MIRRDHQDFGPVSHPSTRKFDDHGDWHYLTLAPKVALGFVLRGHAALREAEEYWYDPRR